jgi:hypothetical protein
MTAVLVPSSAMYPASPTVAPHIFAFKEIMAWDPVFLDETDRLTLQSLYDE